MPIRRTDDIETARIRELPRIPARRTDGEPEGLARADLDRVELEVLAGRDPAYLDRFVVAEDLLDGGANERRIVAETCKLLAVLEQREHAVADRERRCLVAVHQQKDRVRQQLLSCQASALRLGLDKAAE